MAKSDDYRDLFELGFSVEKRLIYIENASAQDADADVGMVNATMASRVIKALLTLESISHEGINMVINSGGGSVQDGWAIYDVMRNCSSFITATVVGHAMSMGAAILQGADHRQITPNADIMIHYGYSGTGSDRINTLSASAAYDRVLMRRMEDLFLSRVRKARPGYPRLQVKKWLTDDKFFTAPQALEYGLVDEILGVES